MRLPDGSRITAHRHALHIYNGARTPNAKIQIKLGLAVFYRRQLVILDTFYRTRAFFSLTFV